MGTGVEGAGNRARRGEECISQHEGSRYIETLCWVNQWTLADTMMCHSGHAISPFGSMELPVLGCDRCLTDPSRVPLWPLPGCPLSIGALYTMTCWFGCPKTQSLELHSELVGSESTQLMSPVLERTTPSFVLCLDYVIYHHRLLCWRLVPS